MKRTIKAILFDFDGVLVNSEMLHFEAFRRAGKDAGIDLTEQEYFADLIGFDDRGAWKQIATRRGITLDGKTLLALMAYKSQVMRQLIEKRTYSALPGVEQSVRSLWRHYPLAICSGALREEIETMLEGIGLRDCFRVITAAEDVGKGKPDPEGYLKTTAAVAKIAGRKIEPASALIVEDAPRVIANARQAGFPTLGVPTSYGVADLQADFHTRSMKIDDLKAAVPSLRIFED
jgi:beta-phosphoglucomutase